MNSPLSRVIFCALAIAGPAAAQSAATQTAPGPALSLPEKNAITGETVGANYSGAWYTPSESGWGVSIAKGDSGTYAVSFYHFGTDHQPVWYILVNPSFDGTHLGGTFYRFSGAWLGEAYSNVPLTSAPAGTGTITFTSATTANFVYTINGAGTFTKSISRLSF